MKFEFFKHKTKEIVPETPKEQMGGIDKSKVATVLGGFSTLVSMQSQAAEKPVQDKKVDGVYAQVPAVKDVTKVPGNYVLGSKESMEEHNITFNSKDAKGQQEQEKIENFKIADDIIKNFGKTAFTSDKLPGYIIIPGDVKHFKATDGYYEYTHQYSARANKISNGFQEDGVYLTVAVSSVDNAPDSKVVEDLEKGKDFGLKVDHRPMNLHDSRLLVYSQLRDKMSPAEILNLFIKTGGTTKQELITALKGVGQEQGYSQDDLKKIGEDVIALNNTPETNMMEQKLAESQEEK